MVVGGGITALELAEGLAANGVTVHYLMRGDRYWASVLDERESALVEARLEHDGVVLHRNVELGRRHRAQDRRDRDRDEGRRASSRPTCSRWRWARSPRWSWRSRSASRRGAASSPTTRSRRANPTSTRPATPPRCWTRRPAARGIDSLWSVAIAQGRVAGANMAGGSESYMPRPAPFNVTKIGGVTTTLIGAVGAGGRDGDLVALARGDSNAWREQLDGFAVATDSGADHLRLILSEDRILGAVVMGDQSLSRAAAAPHPRAGGHPRGPRPAPARAGGDPAGAGPGDGTGRPACGIASC